MFVVATLAGLWGGARVRAESDFLSRLFHRDVQVITVTDVTDAGRLLRQPSRTRPVYYEALVLGYTDFGRSIGGLTPPDKTAMLKFVLKVLADRGYFPANAKHKPEMLLALAWGTMNCNEGMALPFMGGEKLDVMWELDGLSIFNAPQALMRHVRSPTADFVVDVAGDDLYVISVQAFDEAAALQGKTKLLWHTKVSCPATGLDIEPTLKQMAREATPYFGRETAKPVWTIAPEREGRVDLGELKILEMIDPKKLPITDAFDDPPPDKAGATKH